MGKQRERGKIAAKLWTWNEWRVRLHGSKWLSLGIYWEHVGSVTLLESTIEAGGKEKLERKFTGSRLGTWPQSRQQKAYGEEEDELRPFMFPSLYLSLHYSPLLPPTPHSTILSPLSFSLLFASHFFPFFLWELLLLPFWYIWYLSGFYSFTTFLTVFYLTSSSHCFLPLFSPFSLKFPPPLSHHFLSFSLLFLSSFYPS